VPIAFVGGIVALLIAGETWKVSSLVGLIGLFPPARRRLDCCRCWSITSGFVALSAHIV